MTPRRSQTCKTSLRGLVALSAIACALGGFPASAQESASPLVRQMFDGQWPGRGHDQPAEP